VKEERHPKLERLSWAAALLSLVVATGAWIFPEPLKHADFALKPLGEGLEAARPLIVLVLFAFAFTAFAFGSAAKGEAFRFRLEFRGDWTSVVVAMTGVYILGALVTGIAAGALVLNSLTAVIVAALLGSALLMALSAFSRRYRGIHVQGQVSSVSQKGWPRVASFLALTGMLATLGFGLMLFWALGGSARGARGVRRITRPLHSDGRFRRPPVKDSTVSGR